MSVPLIYERSQPGRRGLAIPRPDLPVPAVPAELARREPPRLPEIAEPEVLRHFTALSTRNYGIDTGFYPLGPPHRQYPTASTSAARAARFRDLHPLVDDRPPRARSSWWHLSILRELTGLDAVNLSRPPANGSSPGSCSSLYFADRGEDERRKIVIRTAHGTNPASVTMASYVMTRVRTERAATSTSTTWPRGRRLTAA